MEESQFNLAVDETLEAIEQALEHCDADIDWDLAGGILSIVCSNGTQIIVNRQGPSRQIWVASRSGGYHFDYNAADDRWRQDGLELFDLLSQALTDQCGEPVVLR